MTDQLTLFALLIVVFALLIWGRWRYDLVAFLGLCTAMVLGVVPQDQAFSGFGHPATVIIALVLVISRGLSNSGVIELVAKYVIDSSRRIAAHVSVMAALAAALSALMNNVATLALLMPIDLQAAAKAKRSPAVTLMPLSFASILGGMITLIGTPPNIVISEYRASALGEPYSMFDFAPVGLICAVLGITYVATIGWRLLPAARRETNSARELTDLEGYVAEARVAADSPVAGKLVRELDELAETHDAAIIGLVRNGVRFRGMARRQEIRAGDTLVLEASPDSLDAMVGALHLEYAGPAKQSALAGADVSLLEVVVPSGARIVGRSALSLRLLYRHGVSLLGVSRQGRRFRERVRKLEIRAGDILLLMGPTERLTEVARWLGCLPLAERGLQVTKRRQAGASIAIFGAALALASTGVLYLPVALACAAALMVLLNIIPLRQLYDSVEWSVIVLLGSMIPIGAALETSGGTSSLASGLVSLAAGAPPVVVLVLLIIVTMSLSDIMNNTATAVIAAPVAIDTAQQLGVSPDPLLMGVAVAASCAFLTPIGHKNNVLIMGPGGYRFGDYWRMGLPLELLIVAVATPAIVWFWPF